MSLIFNFAATKDETESIPFCLHERVESTNVSALTAPDDVIVVKDIPVPALTPVTVPPPASLINTPNESPTFCNRKRVARFKVSAVSVPVVVIVPPFMPYPVPTEVTVPVPLVAIIAPSESSPFCLYALVEVRLYLHSQNPLMLSLQRTFPSRLIRL